jgi:hypothetical protein
MNWDIESIQIKTAEIIKRIFVYYYCLLELLLSLFLHVHFYTRVITHVERLIRWTVHTSIFELLNNCFKLEAMCIPAALDVAMSYFLDFLYACCVDLLYVLACVEVVVLVCGVEVHVILLSTLLQ